MDDLTDKCTDGEETPLSVDSRRALDICEPSKIWGSDWFDPALSNVQLGPRGSADDRGLHSPEGSRSLVLRMRIVMMLLIHSQSLGMTIEVTEYSKR
jgi:hypothetical protein